MKHAVKHIHFVGTRDAERTAFVISAALPPIPTKAR
jgi:hypothetical protein